MINKVTNPVRNIPRSMQLSLLIIFFVFLTFAYGATLYLTPSELVDSPIPYLVYTNKVFGEAGLIVATILALAATCSTINTVLASVPRMLHGMAEQGQAFPQLKATNRYCAPWVATLMLAGCTIVPYLFFDIESLFVLVIAATTSWLLAYIVAHLNVMALRRSMPHRARPYRSPLYPLPQLIGIIAMIFVALNNSPDPAVTKQVYTISGGILAGVSVIAWGWVKFAMKKKLFEPDLT